MVDGKKLRNLRKAACMTGEELAYNVGISQTLISGIERGFRQPSIEVLVRIAKKLNTPIESLLKVED
jgi:transcriptional regulator with XRE-family HTH domain